MNEGLIDAQVHFENVTMSKFDHGHTAPAVVAVHGFREGYISGFKKASEIATKDNRGKTQLPSFEKCYELYKIMPGYEVDGNTGFRKFYDAVKKLVNNV